MPKLTSSLRDSGTVFSSIYKSVAKHATPVDLYDSSENQVLLMFGHTCGQHDGTLMLLSHLPVFSLQASVLSIVTCCFRFWTTLTSTKTLSKTYNIFELIIYFSFISIKLAGSLCHHQPKGELQLCIFDGKELRLFLHHSSKKDSLSFL